MPRINTTKNLQGLQNGGTARTLKIAIEEIERYINSQPSITVCLNEFKIPQGIKPKDIVINATVDPPELYVQSNSGLKKVT